MATSGTCLPNGFMRLWSSLQVLVCMALPLTSGYALHVAPVLTSVEIECVSLQNASSLLASEFLVYFNISQYSRLKGVAPDAHEKVYYTDIM